jgi:hypothetical protein
MGLQNILKASFSKIVHMLAVQDMLPDGKAEDRANRRAAAKRAEVMQQQLFKTQALANQEKKVALAECEAALKRVSHSSTDDTPSASCELAARR